MVVLDNIEDTGLIPKDAGAGELLPSGPERQPDYRVLYDGNVPGRMRRKSVRERGA